MFELLALRAYNFVLYEDLKIDFRDLDSNLVFITGKNLDVAGADSNCSGKSLIGDIITDLLFDKTIRRHSQKSFIGKFDKWSFSSLLLRDSISKKRYLIKKFRNHPKYGDKIFFIEKEKKSVPLTRKTKALTYETIWKVLSINWNTFKNRNYFGQDDPDRFLRVTDSKKAEIIVDIQNLSDLQEAKKLANDNVKSSKLEISLLENSLEKVSEYLLFLDKLAEENKEKKASLIKEKESELFDIIEEIESFKKSIESSESILFIKNSINRLEKDLSSIKEKVEKYNLISETIFELKEALSNLKNLIANKTEKKEGHLSKILRAKKEISDLKKLIITTCNKCGAKLNEERTQKSIKTLESETDKTEKEVLVLENEIEKHNLRKTSVIKSLFSETKLLESLAPKIKVKEDKEKEILGLKEKLLNIQALSNSAKSLRKKRDSLIINIEELKNKKDSSSISVKRSLCLKEKSEKEIQLKNAKREIEKNEFSKIVFEKTMRNLFNSFLDNLNHYSNEYLDLLCDDSIVVSFSPVVERKSSKIVDEISVSVSVNGGENRDFRTYSGGEKGRVDLVTQLALFSSAESPFGFLFLDEPTEKMDKTGRDRIMNLLQEISEKGVKIFVVSNRIVPVGFGSVLEIVRKGGKSTIH